MSRHAAVRELTPQHADQVRELLSELEVSETLSQRHLSRRLGMALGMTNLLLRRVIEKGWIKAVKTRPNRMKYFVTPAGLAAKARLTREYLHGTLQFYAQARSRVSSCFVQLSADLDRRGASTKRVVFYGAGELAEIAYVSLQETDLSLAAVVDAQRTKPFFGLPVRRPSELPALAAGEHAFDQLVVMSFDESALVRAELERAGVPADHITWI